MAQNKAKFHFSLLVLQMTLTKQVEIGYFLRRLKHGEVPEWSKGTDCKSAAYSFEGPNPSLSNESLFDEEAFFMGSFYQKGLRFSCTNCRYCCGVEPGFVFLSVTDVQRLAEHFGISKEAFLLTYCRTTKETGFVYSLLEKENNDCIFLSRHGCSVYEDRPVQCRTYPFWPRILEDEESWDSEARRCPGMNHGQLHSKQEIDKCVHERLEAVPMIKWEE